MNLNLTGRHLEITPAIREHVLSKLDKVKRHFDNVIDINVILSVDKLVQKAEATVHVSGKNIHVLIGSGLLGFLGTGAPATAALNVFAATRAVYFLQGLAVTHNLFNARGLPRALQAVAYALLFLQLPVMLLVAGVGAFDLWLDFRTRWARPPEQGFAHVTKAFSR